DIKVENIDTKELLESPQRVKQIVEYILAHHDRKTHSRNFTAMMCVSSVEMLIRYYELFNSKEHSLRIATIFSYSANEEDKGADGLLDDDIHIDEKHINPHSREKLDEYIQEYNQTFGTKYSTKDSNSFYNYYRDIANRVKKREIDILIVVNMFLTGFDSKTLNTLYVDKNLKYHGLIQAFSRTNRILNEQKSQGNIVCFRNLKEATDDAIQLFSNKDAKELILIASYEEYCHSFNQRYQEMIELTPTVESVTLLGNEEEELAFIKAFRELMRLKNILTSFSDFCFGDLEMGEQEFEDYKSKYLDLYDKVKSNRAEERVSILADVDFELELIHKDEITVTYILKLLAQLGSVEEEEEREKLQKSIIDILGAEASLRSKRELIEKFIQEQLPHIKSSDEIDEKFSEFWREEQNSAFENLCKEEGLEPIKLQSIIDEYLYTQRKPLGDEIINIIEERPKLLYRKKIIVKITDKILDFVKCYLEE
ncbi:MAG: type I restriction endonuclease subunit R, partial [Epsilonproteobacteria bacterium]